MIQIIGILCVISTSIGMGTYFIQKERDRLHLIDEVKKMLVLWKGCVRQGNDAIPEVLKNISCKLDSRINLLLNGVVDKMNKMDGDSIKQVWKDKSEEIFKETPLKNDDIELIANIGDLVGFLDKQLQIESLDSLIYEFNERVKKLKEQMIERHRIYRLLSIFGGIFVVIVFT